MEETPATKQDVLTALRLATAQRHAELDAGMPLAASEVDLRAYHDHLRLLEQWLAPIQAWMAQSDAGPKPPDYLHAIRQDLAHPALDGMPQLALAGLSASMTGADASGSVNATATATAAANATATTTTVATTTANASASVGATAPTADWPAQCGDGWRWGAAYVIEGSQLGGVVLYRELADRLAPHPLDYLRGAGSPGPRWQKFLADLREHVASPQQIADACQGAQQAFDSLIALNRARLA